ncbi:MAG: hypothetical protein RR627_00895, partial [Niameybacter sp.]
IVLIIKLGNREPQLLLNGFLDMLHPLKDVISRAKQVVALLRKLILFAKRVLHLATCAAPFFVWY